MRPLIPLPPSCQTPGPITASQDYLRTLVMEHWDAEVKLCEEMKKVQLTAQIQGSTSHQEYIQRLIEQRWGMQVKYCEEARKAQILELLLAAHGIARLS